MIVAIETLKHLLPQFFNTIQNNLLTEYIKDEFLKDCTSKHVTQILSYGSFHVRSPRQKPLLYLIFLKIYTLIDLTEKTDWHLFQLSNSKGSGVMSI